jgi:hypothetical protein
MTGAVPASIAPVAAAPAASLAPWAATNGASTNSISPNPSSPLRRAYARLELPSNRYTQNRGNFNAFQHGSLRMCGISVSLPTAQRK